MRLAPESKVGAQKIASARNGTTRWPRPSAPPRPSNSGNTDQTGNYAPGAKN